MEKSTQRLNILNKINELEEKGLWHTDVEDDPVTKPLLPNKIDYLNKKLSSKILTFFANKAGTSFFEKLIKSNQLIIDNVIGIENFTAVSGGAIITSNHFNPCDNYAIWKAIKPHMKGKLFKVIKEGNYTNSPPPYGFIMRHCNTLPLSSNTQTMKKFLKSVNVLLNKGKKILIYPEQAMWWNYRKPRPFANGAFNLAVSNNVPIIPMFITMQNSDVLDGDGFPVQKYTIHIHPAIYPDKSLSKRESIEKLKNENYEFCKKTYEQVYNTPLVYNTKN